MPFESDAVRKIFLQGMIKVLKLGTTDEYSRTETQTHLSPNKHISLLARPDRFSADSATSKVVPAILFFQSVDKATGEYPCEAGIESRSSNQAYLRHILTRDELG